MNKSRCWPNDIAVTFYDGAGAASADKEKMRDVSPLEKFLLDTGLPAAGMVSYSAGRRSPGASDLNAQCISELK